MFNVSRNGNYLRLKYENIKIELFRVIKISVEGIPCELDSDPIVGK